MGENHLRQSLYLLNRRFFRADNIRNGRIATSGKIKIGTVLAEAVCVFAVLYKFCMIFDIKCLTFFNIGDTMLIVTYSGKQTS